MKKEVLFNIFESSEIETRKENSSLNKLESNLPVRDKKSISMFSQLLNILVIFGDISDENYWLLKSFSFVSQVFKTLHFSEIAWPEELKKFKE